MQIASLLIAFVLSQGVVLAESTKTPPATSETTPDVSPPEAANGEKPPDAENTEKNVRDRDDAAVTPEDQGGEAGDREISAAIRRAIMEDDSLSVNAQNVKIITTDGTVTLRGPVENKAERTTIGQFAEKTAGVKRVDNQLEINAD